MPKQPTNEQRLAKWLRNAHTLEVALVTAKLLDICEASAEINADPIKREEFIKDNLNPFMHPETMLQTYANLLKFLKD